MADVSGCKRVAITITPKKVLFKLLELCENLWTPVSVKAVCHLDIQTSFGPPCEVEVRCSSKCEFEKKIM